MAQQSVLHYALNRGIVDGRALGRVDLDRLALSAETQVNFVSRTLGSMMLRPGLGYRTATRDNLFAVPIPFVFSADDTALIEMTGGGLRVIVDDAPLERPAVGSAITNGTFDADLTGWTDADEAGCTSQWVTGGYAGLTGTGFNAAILRQQVTVADADKGEVHELRIVVGRGELRLRIGATAGDDSLFSATLESGAHSIAVTPVDSFWIELAALTQYQTLVSSCEIGGGGVLVLDAPYAEADLRKLRWTQSGNVVFLACEGYARKKIVRRVPSSWSIEDYWTKDGPFRTINTTRTTLTPSALSGDITLTASSNTFQPGHVGAIFQLTSAGQLVRLSANGGPQWSNEIRVSGTGNARRFSITRAGTWSATVTLQRSLEEPGSWSDVTTYTTNATVTYDDGLDNQIAYYRIGIDTGDYTSGTADLTLDYANGGLTGVVRIVGYTSPTSAAAIVIKPMGATTATTLWAEGQWSDYRGHPTCTTLFEGRLGWFGKDQVNGSASDRFDSFDADLEGDDAPILRSIGDGPVDRINWALALQRLVLGGEGAEYSVKSSSFDEPLTAGNFTVKQCSTQGSNAVPAVRIDNSGVFVQRASRQVYELAYDPQSFDYRATHLSTFVPAIGDPGIVWLAVQRQPDTRVHCVRSDGTVALLVFDRVENVICWQEVETSGEVECAAVLPDEEEDAVYYTVRRTVNGATVRYLERWALETQCVGGMLNRQADAFVTWSGSGGTITGLDHLEGETVVCWADGEDKGEFEVASGRIMLPESVTSAVVGLPYRARFRSAKMRDILITKRISDLALLLQNTHARGLTYGPDFDHLDDMPAIEDGAAVDPDHVWPVYDEGSFTFPGSWETDARLCLEASAPRPVTVLGARFKVTANA